MAASTRRASRRLARAALVLSFLSALSCLAGGAAAAQSYESWYPADNSPLPGTSYPIEVPPLPRELAGIPAAERGYIDHAYSLVLKTLQAKSALMHALWGRNGLALAEGLVAFRAASDEALAALAAEPVPSGLEKFAADLEAGLTLLQRALSQAVDHRVAGAEGAEVFDLADAHTASRKLRAAWTKLDQRYAEAPDDVRKSLYSHLCAVDIF